MDNGNVVLANVASLRDDTDRIVFIMSNDRAGLTPRVKERARRTFLLFMVFNASSFVLVSGNIITLLAIRLQAGSAYIGFLSSLGYASFFSILIGRKLASRGGIVRLFRKAWLLRNISILFALPTPLLFSTGRQIAALVLLGFAICGFQFFRGIGLVANSPLMSEISQGKDRGAYMARVQIVASIVAIIAGIVTAVLLFGDVPTSRYIICFALGIACGFISTLLLFRLPEPPAAQAGTQERVLESVRRQLTIPNFAIFIVSFALFAALSGIVRTFIVVYAREVYAQSDYAISIFTVVGYCGSLLMGLISRHIIDHIGAKPMYAIFTLVIIATLIPIVIAPLLGDSIAVLLFCGVIFLFSVMGITGGEYSGQVYFFGLIPISRQLNLGIIYFLTLGIGGSIGVFTGGFIIEFLKNSTSLSPLVLFRFYFGGIALLLVICVSIIARLERLGARSIATAITTIFSPRMMHTITLLNRIERSDSIREERRLIRGVADMATQLTGDNLVDRLTSPSFVIRNEALNALQYQPMSPRIRQALINEANTQEYTTAYVAARIIGHRGIETAIPVLRAKLASADYMLVSKCIVALARLNDRESIDTIEQILRNSHNPLILTHGAAALRIFGHTQSLPLLFEILHKGIEPTNILPELFLSIGVLFGMRDGFYTLFKNFPENETDVWAELQERIAESLPQVSPKIAATIEPYIGDVNGIDNRTLFGILSAIDPDSTLLHDIRKVLYNRQLRTNPTCHFFFVALVAHLLDANITDRRHRSHSDKKAR